MAKIDVDWERIEADYCATGAAFLSLREIGAKHETCHVKISRKAKKEAWLRGVSTVVSVTKTVTVKSVTKPVTAAPSVTHSGLTPQQEKFAQQIVAGVNQSEAYRAAYSAEKMKPETINRKAFDLSRDGKIAARIEELRQPVAEKAQITLEWHLDELKRIKAINEQALAKAEKSSDVAALTSQMIKAQIAIGKDSGVAKDNKTVDLTSGGKEINIEVNFGA